MNFLILGAGAEELAWARHLAGHGQHRLLATFPGFKGWSAPPDDLDRAAPITPADVDAALALAGVEAVIVGGPPEFRAEALRRVAAGGWPALCLHPPGPDSEAYYQVALSREETGALIVPDLPARLHPGVAALRRAIEDEAIGPFRGLRLESPAEPGPGPGDLVHHDFPRRVDLVRALSGEIEAVTATGAPGEELVVHLRCPQSRRAEVRIWAGPIEPARLIASGAEGSLTFEYDPEFHHPARLIHRAGSGAATITELDPWDPREAMLAVLADAIARREAHPDLLDGTRAMELAEAVVRSLKRGRTIDLHYEEISEAGTFKSVMTSVGCVVFLGALFMMGVAMVGPALGFGWTLYLVYAVPPALIGFMLLQVFRFAIRGPKGPEDAK
jgi:myo-inositol 2-dehydrogenase/D-chiro-inositol 1-dehydrogenase